MKKIIQIYHQPESCSECEHFKLLKYDENDRSEHTFKGDRGKTYKIILTRTLEGKLPYVAVCEFHGKFLKNDGIENKIYDFNRITRAQCHTKFLIEEKETII